MEVILLFTSFLSPILTILVSLLVIKDTKHLFLVSISISAAIALVLYSIPLNESIYLDVRSHMHEIELYKNQSIMSIFDPPNLNYQNMYVWNLLGWIIGNIFVDPKIVMFISVFVTYSTIIFITSSLCKRFKYYHLRLLLLFVIMVPSLSGVVSGIRSNLGGIIILIGLYLGWLKNDKSISRSIITVLVSALIASLIHLVYIPVLVLLLILAIFDNSIRRGMKLKYSLLIAFAIVVVCWIFINEGFANVILKIDAYNETNSIIDSSLYWNIKHYLNILILLVGIFLVIKELLTNKNRVYFNHIYIICLFLMFLCFIMLFTAGNSGGRIMFIPILLVVYLILIPNSGSRNQITCLPYLLYICLNIISILLNIIVFVITGVMTTNLLDIIIRFLGIPLLL